MNQAQTITLYQPTLQRIAYNLVRSKADAEDIVQETFLKWLSIKSDKIQNTKAYLIKAVTNNCLNHIQSLKKKKEEYLDSINVTEFIHRFKENNFAHLDLEADLAKAFQECLLNNIFRIRFAAHNVVRDALKRRLVEFNGLCLIHNPVKVRVN